MNQLRRSKDGKAEEDVSAFLAKVKDLSPLIPRHRAA